MQKLQNINLKQNIMKKLILSLLLAPFLLFGQGPSFTITDNEGNYLFDIRTQKTKTQATINGGKAERENAYLPMEYATLI